MGRLMDSRGETYRAEQVLEVFKTLNVPKLAKEYIVKRAAGKARREGRQQ